ncbi:MFS transporter [Novosphingobium flavum]|uniref:Alpha-ketoglutarate permease n=1 Tax=Novosphingobium flavum TaxID=1778672 RepID=A0A7X1FSH3_9SPHN|nr:MFS family transporter [Novosphingobium flavum]MBC2665512.1 MFS transporter [Novosphingobium flavum]
MPQTGLHAARGDDGPRARVTVVSRGGDAAGDGAYTEGQRRRRLSSIVAASSGNLVEWFDFYIYAFCAIYFAPAFFPRSDPTGQLLNTAGVFAAGFIMRPLGGWMFGRIADRHGRRNALVLSVLSMCVGSLVIAFMPTYAAIGPMAPVVLLLARLLQGLSVGGEYGTAATYMSEVALRGRRGFFSSFQYVTLIGGQLSASLVVVILQQLLSEGELRAWGWRVPFVIGAITALGALVMRLRLSETVTAADRNREEAGSFAAIWNHHRSAFLTVLGFTAGGSLIFYTFTIYMQKFLVNSTGMTIRTSSAVMTGCLFIFMCAQPVLGALSDRIGRRASMIVFGALGTFCTIPLLEALHGVTSPWAAFALIAAALVMISFYTSVSAILKAELFPAEVRAVGVGFSYALANALFGGTAEYAALTLKAIGRENWFYYYVTGMMALVLVISLGMAPRARYLGHDS